jgi:hypothetical protein
MWGIDRTSTTRSTPRAGRIPASSRPAHRRTRRAWRIEQLEGRTLLSTWPVTSPDDTGPNTLRWAIDQANASKGDDTIDIQVTGTITLKSALPDLSDTTGLTQIKAHEGTSPTVARGSDPGTPEFRIFTVDAGVKAELDGLTIEGGYVYGYDTGGGGVRNDGTLTVSHSMLDNNFASLGGGIFNDGILTVSDSTISDNHTSAPGSSSGGGIFNVGGDARLVSCTVAGNAGTYGGGIRNADSGTLTVISSVIKNNTAEFTGGGICNGFDSPGSVASVDVSSSTIENNTAGGFDGGGIFNSHTLKMTSSTIVGNSADRGGGIFSYTDLTVDSCTIFGNSTQNAGRGNGGGIYVETGPATILSSTIAGNSAVTGGGIYIAVDAVTLTNTIVAQNLVSGSSQDIQGAVATSSHNLVGVDAGLSGVSNGVGGNIVGTTAAPIDPKLGPLQDNGGPTWTMALLPGSKAIDAGDSTNAPPTDQRGFARVGPPDIGAFEFGGKSQGAVYDAANDFSLASNPNGFWSYGYENSLGSSLQLYDTGVEGSQAIDGQPGDLRWYSSTSVWVPDVGYNSTSSEIRNPDGTVILPPHSVHLHPGSGGQFSVIRWTAPTAGVFSLDVAFRGDDFAYPTSTDVHVLHNGNSLFSGGVYVYGPADSFEKVVSVQSGDTIDFVVGVGSDGYFFGDTTGISATLTEVQGPAVDTTPPTTTASLSGTEGSPGWYVGPVMVALHATDPDDATGSLVTTASLDGGPTFTYDPAYPLRIIGDGVHTLTYQSRDPAGNVEAMKTQAIRIGQVPSEGDFEWIHQFGGVGTSDEMAEGVAASNGYVYVAGHTSGVLAGQMSAGAQDVFLRKYDSAGNALWTRQFGTPADEEASGVAVDATGVYVSGFTYGAFPGQVNSGGADVFVRKYDFDGNVLWTRQLGGTDDDFANHIAVGASGVYVVGTTRGALPGQPGQGSGNRDAFLLKYDTAGDLLWTRQFGSADYNWDYGNDVFVDASGVYVAGNTFGTMPGQTSVGDDDPFVRKYDADGNEVWTRQFGSPAHDDGSGITGDATGIYVSGEVQAAIPGQTFAGEMDGFVRKYDREGNVLWTRQFGTPGSDYAWKITEDATGVYVAGFVGGALPGQTSAGGQDAFVRKYDQNGNEVWTHQFGTPAEDFAWGITAGTTGLYVTGYTDGTLPGQVSAGGRDAFVAKISQSTPQPAELVIDGDQSGPTNDQIDLRLDPDGKLFQVDVNGTRWSAPLNEVPSITIHGLLGDDVIRVEATAAGIPVSIDGGDGNDVIDIGIGALDTIQGPVNVVGGGGTDTMTVDDSVGTNYTGGYTLDATRVGRAISPIGYAGVEDVRLYGDSASNTYAIIGVPSNTRAAVYAGSADDIFNVGGGTLNGLQGPVTVSGGGGSNTLNIDDSASPAPPAGRYTYLVSAMGVHRLWAAGITYSDMGQVLLKGSDSASNYIITGPATDAPVSITAGAGDDVFAFMGAARLGGRIDGGGGNNTLDYSNYGQGVTVDLSAGTATGVAGGIAHIQNVMGSRYDDTLIGDAASNILVGNGGDDTIQGGGGRDLIIGGAGRDTLVGGSDDDLIIAGSTAYDNNLAALDAILAEWRSGDDYSTRVARIGAGVGSGHYRLVLNQTVFDDHAADAITGGGGTDWIWDKT